MRPFDVTLKLLGLAEVIRKWQGMIRSLDSARRKKVARFAAAIASTLGRAARAFERLEKDPMDRTARRGAIRELGQLAGYVETIVATLQGHIDGRRLAGVKRRLETLATEGGALDVPGCIEPAQVERLLAAEGYFLALADSLET